MKYSTFEYVQFGGMLVFGLAVLALVYASFTSRTNLELERARLRTQEAQIVAESKVKQGHWLWGTQSKDSTPAAKESK